ncbi:MAG: carboxypeptidase regulatory-like domain-containing protein [Deltaproteobacteria bacterium]|nr:carboxypeptidase regulatory-like domain-containing protein [Deltaproteobacteria bacterium]
MDRSRARSSRAAPDESVELAESEVAEASAFATTTDGNGAFFLASIPEGEYSVVASGEGYRRVSRRIKVEKSKPIEVELRHEGSLTLSGRVVDAKGRPRSFLLVEGFPAARGSTGREEYFRAAVLTGGDGSFTLTELKPGPYEINVSKQNGDGVLSRGGTRARAGDKDVQVVVPLARMLSGRLVGPNGQPIAHGNVGRSFVRDASGRFEVEAGVEAETLKIRAEGFAPLEKAVPGGEQDLDLGDIVLQEGRTVRGRVVDAAGAPVAAWVRGLGTVPGRRRLEEAAAAQSGAFEVDGLPKHGAMLQVHAEARAPKRVEVPDGVDQLTITMEAGATVRGLVVDNRGEPIPGIWVQGESFGAKTGPDGRFELNGVEPGTYRMTAAEHSEVRRRFEIKTFEVKGAAPVELTIGERKGSDVEVSVVDSAGESVAGCTAFLVPGPTVGTTPRRYNGTVYNPENPGRASSMLIAAVPPGAYERTKLLT